MLSEFSGRPWLGDQSPEAPPAIRVELANISVPTLLINGDQDHPEFLAVARLLERELPDATAVRIPSAGGFPLWAFPGAVNERVHRFLCGG
jgi:pimeloyl-ACP methyl ester carboxylesterase